MALSRAHRTSADDWPVSVIVNRGGIAIVTKGKVDKPAPPRLYWRYGEAISPRGDTPKNRVRLKKPSRTQCVGRRSHLI